MSRLPETGFIHQQGIALITVLLVLAVVSVALVSMSTGRQFDIRRTETQLRSAQTWEYAHSLEAWAATRLQEDFSKTKFDGEKDLWAKPLKTKAVPGGNIAGRISELQGRLNLNNLLSDGKASDEDVQRLKRLFTYLNLKPELVEAIVDWIDEDQDIRYPDGAEDETYTALDTPYRAPNQYFADVSELVKVQGISDKVYRKILPYIYVADSREKLNINTASPMVLRCLADDISKDTAESMYRANGKPFESVDDFLKDEALNGIVLNKDSLTVTSKHFLLSGHVAMGNQELNFQSQLIRNAEGEVKIGKRQRRSPAYE
ncbi:MAG: general secretion pathway protein GspK [Methylomonas sp.]|nr:MAG: general secretion pathway protein GspK [Methylomonas sp.]